MDRTARELIRECGRMAKGMGKQERIGSAEAFVLRTAVGETM
jgi:hypothetical protein